MNVKLWVTAKELGEMSPEELAEFMETAKPKRPERPELPVTLNMKGDNWLWDCKDCPFCGEHHTHGGGLTTEDPRELLTDRTAHCQPFERKPAGGRYRLVLASEKGIDVRGLDKFIAMNKKPARKP